MHVIVYISILLSLLSYPAQEEDKWRRLYTFDDATVEVSTSNIRFGTDFTGRVRFRLTLSKSGPLLGNEKSNTSVS